MQSRSRAEQHQEHNGSVANIAAANVQIVNIEVDILVSVMVEVVNVIVFEVSNKFDSN